MLHYQASSSQQVCAPNRPRPQGEQYQYIAKNLDLKGSQAGKTAMVPLLIQLAKL